MAEQPVDVEPGGPNVAGEAPAVEPNETDEDVGTFLGRMADRLEDLGMVASWIGTRVDRDQEALDAIVEAADAFNIVITGETDPSVTTSVFGMPPDHVADRLLGPVLVVQRGPSEETER